MQLVPVGFGVVVDAFVVLVDAGLDVEVALVDVEVGLVVEVLLMVAVGWEPPVAVQVPIGPGALGERIAGSMPG